MTITIQNWQRYQTASERHKHWLKIHTRLLHSPDIMDALSASERWIWLGLLLLALGHDGRVIGSPSFIARQLGVRPSSLTRTLTKLTNLSLVSDELVTSPHTPIASTSPNSPPKSALEREREKEKKRKDALENPKPADHAAPLVAAHLSAEQKKVLTKRTECYLRNVGRLPSTEVIERWLVRLGRGERI